jgi:hypothetical protein
MPNNRSVLRYRVFDGAAVLDWNECLDSEGLWKFRIGTHWREERLVIELPETTNGFMKILYRGSEVEVPVNEKAENWYQQVKELVVNSDWPEDHTVDCLLWEVQRLVTSEIKKVGLVQ